MNKKESLTEATILALTGKLTEAKEDDISIVSKALKSNNVPYIIKKDTIILDFDNKQYNKLSTIDKDKINFSNDGKVAISCVLSPYYLNFVSEKDKDMFRSNGQAVLDTLNWIDLNENLPEIIKLFSIVNKVYIKTQEQDNANGINYASMTKYAKPMIEMAIEDKYGYNKDNITKIKELSKNEEFIKSIIEFIKTKI